MSARLRTLWAALIAAALANGCTPDGEASVLVDLTPLTAQGALRGVGARLTLTDEDGDHPRAVLPGVGDDGGDRAFDVVDLPVPCNDVGCDFAIRVRPGRYDARLVLSARDRCGAAADVFAYAGVVDVDHWGVDRVVLDADSAAFDDDADGVIDILEAAACGRFGFVEGAAPPQACSDASDPCCEGTSPLEGKMQSFAGGTTTLPYDKDGVAGSDVVEVAAFAVDATEVTYGQFERCVLAGACQANAPDRPARGALQDGVDRRTPVRDVSPVDAAAYCAFVGKRLPSDAEWDFAAADRDGARARYPLDVDVDANISCDPAALGPAAAHQQAEASCAVEPQRVGAFVSSIARRGVGDGVADLAGNVAEWTLIRGAAVDNSGDVVDVDADGVPDGVVAVVLRGGGATSVVQLLENDLPLIFDVDDDGDRVALVAAQANAGFRCAADVAIAPPVEDVCPDSVDLGGGDSSGDNSGDSSDPAGGDEDIP
jgi:formylglycine-generating enzyme required for sulfatase activity